VLSSLLRSAINKACSNSWLTVPGRWATASDTHSQSCLQTFFFLFLWWDNNLTTPAYWKTYWNCIASELGKLCVFGFFFFFAFLVFFLLMRQWQNYFWHTISRIGGWRTNAKIIKTETLLHLNLEIFFSLIILFFIFIFFQFLFYLFYFLCSLCFSNACSTYCWLVQ
jgi:hypothetical protein